MTPKANIIDRAVDWALQIISPPRAAARQHLRLMNSSRDYREGFFALMRARGYRSAKSPAGATGWLASGNRTADQENRNDIPTLRDRAHELRRDDPIADGLVGTFISEVIGTGMRPQANTADADKDQAMEEIYAERADYLAPAENMTAGERQRTTFGELLTVGEHLIKKTITKAGEPVWFEHIEGYRLQQPVGVKTRGGVEIRDGVERDKFGRIQAYWIMRHSPETGAGALPMATEIERIPADQIAHLALKKRFGQSRGVTLFHSILQDLRDLDLLMLASLKRAQISACLAVFIKSTQTLQDMMSATAREYDMVLDQALEPGMIMALRPGEEVQTLVPNFPVPELVPFIIALARRIGVAVGVCWQVVLRDFSQSSYSSARTDILQTRRTYKIFQELVRNKWLRWEWMHIMEDAQLRGDKRMRGITKAEMAKVQFIPDGWDWVDPATEAEATEKELEIGVTTLQEECSLLGKDWKEVQDQRLVEEAREIEQRTKLKLPLKQAAVPPAAAA